MSPGRWWIALALLAAGSLLTGGAVAADAPAASAAAPPAIPAEKLTNASCLGCHDDDTLKKDDGTSVAIHADKFGASAHKRQECVACHADAKTTRHPKNALGPVAADACVECHEDELEAFKPSIHALKKGDGPQACEGCHGDVHEVLKQKDPNNSMSPVNQIRNCGQCHQGMMEGYLQSEHARALLVSGLNGAPGCTGCHGSHRIVQPGTTNSPTSHAKAPETCGNCHAGILAQWRGSAHGALWAAGKTGGPVCTTCHEAHAIKSPQSAAMRLQFPKECGSCHQELFETFHDSFHGKASSLGHASAAMCSDCHTAHRSLPASDARSSVNPANLAKTCGKCHEGAVNASFVTFDPHSNPRDPQRNAYVFWVWVFMTGLLLGVFAFFGAHDLLWLQRTLVGRLRGEFRTVHHSSGPYVRRFTSTQIWVHVTIVVSFLLLAATGLPLKFAGASWAPGLMKLLGGPEVAGFLHRVAAIVTFGYFAFHVLNMLYDMLVKKQRGYLWGWRSMVPQLADVKDFWANLKFFLYAGPRPRLDRWAYWEKFDYLAVFWGVAMIGFSGLMLWFPGFFTRFVPGWVLNAAYVVHSDEALLATGFIFLFHFFHTHLRPEAFPMDPVVFTGRMPLERFKEERPREYQRLVEEGRLESVLAPAPQPHELRRAYVFGAIAVAIGVALAVGIFVALLGTLR